MADKLLSVDVDENLCVGSATCVGLAPAHFRMGPDGVAEPITSPTTDDDDLREAAECCPVQAIRITE